MAGFSTKKETSRLVNCEVMFWATKNDEIEEIVCDRLKKYDYVDLQVNSMGQRRRSLILRDHSGSTRKFGNLPGRGFHHPRKLVW
jgi:hypothetical protein